MFFIVKPPSRGRLLPALGLLAVVLGTLTLAGTLAGTGHGQVLPAVAGATQSSSPVLQPPTAGSACLECHQELRAKTEVKSRHQPFLKGECTACHESLHTGSVRKRTPEEDIALCLSCHPQGGLGYSHPVGPSYVDAVTGRPLTCSTSCHDPHGSQYKALGRVGEGDRLCLSCHKM